MGETGPPDAKNDSGARLRAVGQELQMVDRTATLFINDDYSRCGACGGAVVDPEHSTHHTATSDWPPSLPAVEACGARFAAVSSDILAHPEIEGAIRELRPDLPFIGAN